MFNLKSYKFVFILLLTLALMTIGAGFFNFKDNSNQSKVASSNTLDSFMDSLIFEFDASSVDSYSGKGTYWKNLVKKPADGSDPSAYDLILGKTIKKEDHDPSFVKNRFLFDGNDFFILKGIKGDQKNKNTPFLSYLSDKDKNKSWWFSVAFRTSAEKMHLRNEVDFLNVSDWLEKKMLRGIVLSAKSSASFSRVRFIQAQNGKAAVSYLTPTFDFFPETDYLLIVSYSAEEDKARIWFNSRKGKEIPMYFTLGDLETNRIATFGGNLREIRQNYYPKGWSKYFMAMGYGFLSDEKAASMIGHLEQRHQRDYTPFELQSY